MKKIFITGVSGTGKTTIATELEKLGYYTISLDEYPNLCKWKNNITGEVVDYEAALNKGFIDTHEWLCDVDKLKELLNVNEKVVFVLGSAANQNGFLNLFDKKIVLSCKPETFIKRILQREDNEFGKDESAQKHILATYQEFEEELLKAGAIKINAEKPIKDVVESILNSVS